MSKEKTKKLRMFEVIKLPQSNSHLPEPFRMGEKVIYVRKSKNKKQPKSFNKQFFWIKRIASKSVINESRNCFREIGKK